MEKTRLDVLLFEQGHFESREAARRAVMAGLVSVDGERIDKPGTRVSKDTVISVKRPAHQFVSRGGLKLERALERFQIDVSGRIAIDVGASTGGFTDCLLQHGASQVFSVDVGYGQLAWTLRQDPRVHVMERMNFRHADKALFVPSPSLAVMDVSFISTKLLFQKLQEVCTPHAEVVSLIKPQFEAGRDAIGKGGIVRDREVHIRVLMDMLKYVTSIGWSCRGLDFSPISGGDGNIEFLGWWRMSADSSTYDEADAETRCRTLVDEAWLAVGAPL